MGDWLNGCMVRWFERLAEAKSRTFTGHVTI
jgi:hypothetical protein